MDIYENAEQLKKIPLLSGSDNTQLKLLAFTSEALDFNRGDYLFRINDVSDSVYVILAGEVDVVRDENPDNITKLATIGKNNIMGEMGVFLDIPRTASLIAIGEVKALRIPANRFIKLVTQNADVALEVMRQLSKKIVFTSELAVESQTELRDLQAAKNGP